MVERQGIGCDIFVLTIYTRKETFLGVFYILTYILGWNELSIVENERTDIYKCPQSVVSQPAVTIAGTNSVAPRVDRFWDLHGTAF